MVRWYFFYYIISLDYFSSFHFYLCLCCVIHMESLPNRCLQMYSFPVNSSNCSEHPQVDQILLFYLDSLPCLFHFLFWKMTVGTRIFTWLSNYSFFFFQKSKIEFYLFFFSFRFSFDAFTRLNISVQTCFLNTFLWQLPIADAVWAVRLNL